MLNRERSIRLKQASESVERDLQKQIFEAYRGIVGGCIIERGAVGISDATVRAGVEETRARGALESVHRELCR